MAVALDGISDSVTSLVVKVASQATPRQLRLFAVACCRLVWDRMTNEASRAAVEVAERFADGLASVAELDAVRRPAYQVRGAGDLRNLAAEAAKRDSPNAAVGAAHVISYAVRDDRDKQLLVLLDVFENTPFRGMPRPGERFYTMNRDCDIHGHDFRGVRLEPAWLTHTAVALANGIYSDRAFDRMPILADVLEEAGCDNADVLLHCRGEGPHVRGCWVVDLVLGKA